MIKLVEERTFFFLLSPFFLQNINNAKKEKLKRKEPTIQSSSSRSTADIQASGKAPDDCSEAKRFCCNDRIKTWVNWQVKISNVSERQLPYKSHLSCQQIQMKYWKLQTVENVIEEIICLIDWTKGFVRFCLSSATIK